MTGSSRSGALAILLLAAFAPGGQAGVAEDLLDGYRAAGAGQFDAQAGAQLWRQDFAGRSCRSCHGDNPRRPGRHQRTGKRIAPLSPTVNPQRLQDATKVAKWLYRNCKWTLGRECSAQEKGDLISWLARL